MYKELTVCRAIMRLYSFCEFDLETSKIKVTQANNILTPYFEIEPTLKYAFKKVGIEMYPTGVLSGFDGETKIVLEVFFIHTAHSMHIPDEVLSCLTTVLTALGRKPPLCTSQTLQWAYTGRWIDKSKGHKFVTDGLQMSDNRILLDFVTYSTASHDCLHHRLIHELLHTLGVEEEEMNDYIFPACAATYEMMKPFIQLAQSQVKKIGALFSTSLQDLGKNEPILTKRLIEMGDKLCVHGFPEKMDTPIYTTTYMPDRLFPNISVSGYTVLLM